MSRGLSREVLDDIRIRSDIVELIGSQIRLQKAGGNFKALCPFHKEKTPSFQVNPQRQIFHCFGCGVGGDVFAYVMQMEHLDFMGAVRYLADRAGIHLEFQEGDHADHDRKRAMYETLQQTDAFYQRCLKTMPAAQPARDYLAQRKIEAASIEAFGIGFAPDRGDTLEKMAKARHLEMDLLETVGLVVRRENPGRGSPWYDRFRGRIIFPIRDEQGRTIGFSGRILTPDAKAAKYVNTPETPLFHKGRILYAIDRARRAIADQSEALVCEGQIDVIRCHAAGFTNAVASQGTAFTADHARILHRYADSTIIGFDGDTAGEDAAIKTAGLFLQADLSVRVATMAPGEDPDSFILKEGADAFRTRIEQAQSVIAFQVQMHIRRSPPRNLAEFMRISRAVLETIAMSSNATMRERLMQEASRLLNIPLNTLHENFRKILQSNRPRPDASDPNTPDATHPTDDNPPPVEEIELCTYLARYADTAALVAQYLPPKRLTHPLCRAFVQAALYAAESGQDIQDVIRADESPAPGLDSFAARIFMAPAKLVGTEVTPQAPMQDLIMKIWQRSLELERNLLGPDQAERRTELTCSLRHFKSRNWDDATGIMTLETSP